ncbi:MAG: hypothetical protein A3F74_26655 [Betaproteobacteria bacterium RIFCSPLOWO2_12_FULL_62_58]|nr:MAG: hypothetical protein A3F74_26655 [Betaproteobacteria bacterium RIFCSPLOWO2_12_FULL_62_58]
MPRAKIAGTATIDAPKGAKLSINRGDLRIQSLTNGSRRIVPDAQAPNPLTLQAEAPDQFDAMTALV